MKRRILTITLAVLLAAVGTVAVLAYVHHANVRAVNGVQAVSVIVAQRAIPSGTAGSGGRGRRWDVANLVVYYSNTNNLEHRDQSQERAKDMTKTDNTAYVDLMARGTVDEKFIRALRKKMDLAAVITNDNYREWLI